MVVEPSWTQDFSALVAPSHNVTISPNMLSAPYPKLRPPAMKHHSPRGIVDDTLHSPAYPNAILLVALDPLLAHELREGFDGPIVARWGKIH